MIAWEDYADFTLTPEEAQNRLEGRCKVYIEYNKRSPNCFEATDHECYCHYVTRQAALIHRYNYGYI